MKAIFAILALCIVTTYAAVVPETSKEFEPMLENVFAKVKQLELHKEEMLKRYYEKVPTTQIQQIDAALESIEKQKDDNEDCIGIVKQEVAAIMQNFFNEKGVCLATTHKSAEQIIMDIDLVISEILVDAYELTLLYKQCAAETDSVQQGLCYTRFSIKIIICVNELRLTIKSLVQSSNQSFEIVMAEANACNQRAVDNTVQQIENVRPKVDACVTNN